MSTYKRRTNTESHDQRSNTNENGVSRQRSHNDGPAYARGDDHRGGGRNSDRGGDGGNRGGNRGGGNRNGDRDNNNYRSYHGSPRQDRGGNRNGPSYDGAGQDDRGAGQYDRATQNRDFGRTNRNSNQRNNQRYAEAKQSGGFHPREDVRSLATRRSIDVEQRSIQRLADNNQTNDGWESGDEANNQPEKENDVDEKLLSDVAPDSAVGASAVNVVTHRVDSDPEAGREVITHRVEAADSAVDHDAEKHHDVEETVSADQRAANAGILNNFVTQNNKRYQDVPQSIDDFEDMPFLTMSLFEGIQQYGFKYPSPVQARTIHIVNRGFDLIAQSQPGSGKTGAFSIGGLSRIDVKDARPQVMILSPTRDLACQIAKVVEHVATFMRINVCLCVGGNNQFHTNVQEARRSHVLVCTPGRLSELIKRQAFDSRRIVTFIMDEADELLKDDFKDQLMEIIKNLGQRTQICVYSSTYSDKTLKTTENFLRDPYRIRIEKEELSLKAVKQFKINLRSDRDKFPTLDDLLPQLCIPQMMIFVNSIKTATILRDKLMDRNYEAGLIHGKMNNEDRESVLLEFRLAKIKFLITTDVMCRGIDIDDLRIVINYDMALDPETYIHRVGRSGRYGSQGVAINFCTYDDMHRVKLLERDYGTVILPMPNPDEINHYLTGIQCPHDKVLSSNNYKTTTT